MFDPELHLAIRELDLQRPEIRRRMEAQSLVATRRASRAAFVSRKLGSGLIAVGDWLEDLGNGATGSEVAG